MTLTPEQWATYERLAKILGPSSDMAILLTAHDALAAENRALREAVQATLAHFEKTGEAEVWGGTRVLVERLHTVITATRPPEAPEEKPQRRVVTASPELTKALNTLLREPPTGGPR